MRRAEGRHLKADDKKKGGNLKQYAGQESNVEFNVQNLWSNEPHVTRGAVDLKGIPLNVYREKKLAR